MGTKHFVCRNSNRPLIQNLNTTLDPNIGFQVDRVKHAELGEGKVRLTAYYQSNGKVSSGLLMLKDDIKEFMLIIFNYFKRIEMTNLKF